MRGREICAKTLRTLSAGTCSELGESSQLCTEDCADTSADGEGGACAVTVELEVCTCSGRKFAVRGTKEYDMKSGEEAPRGEEEAGLGKGTFSFYSSS